LQKFTDANCACGQQHLGDEFDATTILLFGYSAISVCNFYGCRWLASGHRCTLSSYAGENNRFRQGDEMTETKITPAVRGAKVAETGGAVFTNQHMCSACDFAPDAPGRVCHTVNGVVKTAFQNLQATGRTRQESARSALTVLRIHQPSLCACNMNFVENWLLQLRPSG
jgi:hypothetical protein